MEGEMEGWMEGGKDGWREGWREGEMEGRMDGGREGGKERGRKRGVVIDKVTGSYQPAPQWSGEMRRGEEERGQGCTGPLPPSPLADASPSPQGRSEGLESTSGTLAPGRLRELADTRGSP